MSRWNSYVLVALAVLTGVACSAEMTGLPEAMPTKTGVVLGVYVTGPRAQMGVGSVERVDRRPTSYDTVQLGVTELTEIFVEGADGVVQPGSISDLEAGVRIRFVHHVTERRSLPPQYGALQIWVLRP
jgi:hypothetical protein